MTRVTNHAARRTKERLGLPKKLSHKNAENALPQKYRKTAARINRKTTERGEFDENT